MNGKAQYYTNIAMTLAIGLYGVVNALYSEFLRPIETWRGWVLASNFTIALGLVSLIWFLLGLSYELLKNNSVSNRD